MKRSRANMTLESEVPVTMVQKTELDLFSNPVEQNVILSTKDVEYGPDFAITDTGPIMFSISGDSDHFTDLANTYIMVQLRVLKSDGGVIPKTVAEKVEIMNYA